MKKYLFGILAIVLAVGFSAFTTASKEKTGTIYRFVLSAPATGTNLQQIATESSIDYYVNWTFESTESTLTTCATGEERGCKVAVDGNYVYDFGGETGQRLLAEDPDAGNPKIAFPMSVENGLFADPVQYKKVATSIHLDDVREIRNGTVN